MWRYHDRRVIRSAITRQALRDGDKVWGTLCTGTNQDGHTVTPMTAPSGSQQERLLHSVYDKFKVDVDQLDYIEAHGNSFRYGSLPRIICVHNGTYCDAFALI